MIPWCQAILDQGLRGSIFSGVTDFYAFQEVLKDFLYDAWGVM